MNRSAEAPPKVWAGLSACIISFNEEENIAACIDSVAWCDEVVVIDSFSQDRTAEIARGRGAKVIQRKWAGHVAQKNVALDAAAHDWVLSLDCDERVTPKLRQEIGAILSSPRKHDGYYISRKLFYLGRWLEHGGWFPEWRLRLFRKSLGRWAGMDPHDTVEMREGASTGKIQPRAAGERSGGIEDAVILHCSFRDLSHQLKVLDRYSEIQAGELSHTGKRAVTAADLILRPCWRFLLTYLLKGGFLDGASGYHMAVNHAYAAYMKYAKLWEIQRGLAKVRAKEEMVPSLSQKPQSESHSESQSESQLEPQPEPGAEPKVGIS
ncbi:MAG: glycosyltransferase family 2 protein [Planctomycetes bacterium]|nr:glycosyltransferase family 2 protein [Planctomycetota bacterium]